jgi:hypothetical protein
MIVIFIFRNNQDAELTFIWMVHDILATGRIIWCKGVASLISLVGHFIGAELRTIRLTSGHFYDSCRGQIERGEKHGKGVYYWPNGNEFKGDFVYGASKYAIRGIINQYFERHRSVISVLK